MRYKFYSYLIMLSDNSDATLEKLKNKLEDFYSKDDSVIKILLNQNKGNYTVRLSGTDNCFDGERMCKKKLVLN